MRVRRHLDSETLHIPELRELIGRDVENVVTEDPPHVPPVNDNPLKGSILRDDERPEFPVDEGKPLEGSILWYDDPFGPASEDWETDR